MNKTNHRNADCLLVTITLIAHMSQTRQRYPDSSSPTLSSTCPPLAGIADSSQAKGAAAQLRTTTQSTASANVLSTTAAFCAVRH